MLFVEFVSAGDASTIEIIGVSVVTGHATGNLFDKFKPVKKQWGAAILR